MASNLTDQVHSISEVTKAVALGDLGKLVNVNMQGKMLDLKMTANSMVAQLSTLANEVTGSWVGRLSYRKFKGCGRFVVHIYLDSKG